jgi:hypothetical protein
MKDFKRLEPRQLKENTQEELTFKVSVPTYVGNDFQGLACEVEITFNAQSILDGGLTVDLFFLIRARTCLTI